MNSASACHEVENCPGLYVDAFRGKYLRRMQDPENAFVLTHYHGDHYQSLPRDGKYQGPAHIHCTPVTASLLIQVHQVPADFVIAHAYGSTFAYAIKGKNKGKANITFYDANHCPGACIVLIQLPDGTSHLHTGDMRYHEKFQTYPLLRDAVIRNKLDVVYLDTTYSHPKHDFITQDEAVETIASQATELLGSDPSNPPPGDPRTLVLLSCYSIGKEKVLWEASTRTNQLVYVSEKKLRMLKCVKGHEAQEVSSQIIHRCTEVPTQSSLHVIPMGLAGELWPFFRPNFLKCAKYVQDLPEQGVNYDKVVAFLPTGWAHGSKWNREHAVSQKMVDRTELGKPPLDVEIRLVPYSEHSTFSELTSFVKFLRPRKVVPTVFSDEAEYRKIEGRFRNLMDSTRAKKAFFRTMEQAASSPDKSAAGLPDVKESVSPTKKAIHCTDKQGKQILVTSTSPQTNAKENIDDEIELLEVKASTTAAINEEYVSTIVSLGFTRNRAVQALGECAGNLEQSIDSILNTATGKATSMKVQQGHAKKVKIPPSSSLPSDGAPKKRKMQSGTRTTAITSFFTRKCP